jgi:hypothetical protein
MGINFTAGGAESSERMEPRGRERHRWANREVEVGGST